MAITIVTVLSFGRLKQSAKVQNIALIKRLHKSQNYRKMLALPHTISAVIMKYMTTVVLVYIARNSCRTEILKLL